jgi:CysZ protein
MISPFLKGVGYAVSGLRALPRPGIRRFVAVPLLVNVLVFGLGVWFSADLIGRLVDDWVGIAVGWLPEWLSWLGTVITSLLWVLFAVGALILIFYSFTAVANLIASPFNGVLAERIEAEMTGSVITLEIPLWREVLVAPVQELRKISYFALRAVPLLVLFVIPGVNVLAPIIWALFGAWMLALQYADYPMANHGIRFRDQRSMLGAERAVTLGFGAGVLILTMIPVLNFLAMPAAVIGATQLWVERLRDGAPTRRPAS